jgi:hypothetical protein
MLGWPSGKAAEAARLGPVTDEQRVWALMALAAIP